MSTGLLKKLSQDYKNLVESSEFADISIQVGDESNKAYFYAHSLILRTRSSYFREVLSKLGDKLESEKVILFDKPNITPKLFEILFRYIYDGTVNLANIEFSEIIFLLWGAYELNLKELCNYIENIIMDQKELVKKHISLINRKGLSNFKKLDALWKQFVIEDTDIFNSNDFTTLQKEEFLHFYINRPNNVTEIELWEKLLKWATIQSGSLPSDVSQYADNHFATLKKIIKPFIQYINFKSIRKDDFYQNVHPFNKAFDPKIYIKILEIYTFNINQESSITNKPFDNLSISPSSLNISSILPNQSSKKSAILTTDVKLPISLEINFGTSTIKSTTITASKPNTVTDIKPTDSTFASTSITSTFIPMRQLTIQSNIIEQNHIVLIVKWINEISNLNQNTFYTFNLLQRASRHGSSSKKFHARCDTKGPTLLILRVKDTNEILGGYNPIDWYKETSKNVYHETSTSFIFSINLQNIDNSIVSKVIDTKHAIRQNRYTGPSFGKNDLKICGELKENEKSRCRKSSYEKPIRNNTEFFSVDDYEVFQVFRKSTLQN